MAYTSLTRQSSNLTKKGDATRDRSRDNTKGTVQYLVTYAYTNNNYLLSTSNITISVAIPTWRTLGVADPGSGGPREWRSLGVADPGSGGPWEWRTQTETQ